MAEFTLTLVGHADPDAVREAFNTAVLTVREAIDEGFELSGELVLDGVPYSIGDVPEEVAPDTGDDAATEEVAEEEATEEETAEGDEEEDEVIVGTAETETQP